MILIGPLVFVIFLILKKLKFLPSVFICFFLLGMGGQETADPEKLRCGINYYNEGNIAEAKNCFKEASLEYLNIPEILYNLSLCAYMESKYADSVQLLMRAITLSPFDARYRELLSWIEQELSLEQSVAPPGHLHPDIPFFLFLFFTTAASIVAIINLAKKRGFYAIITVLCVVLAVGSGVVLRDAGKVWDREIGITKGPSSIRKIPKETAQAWIEIPEGVSLIITGESEGFYLVETGLSVLGWVKIDSFLPPLTERNL